MLSRDRKVKARQNVNTAAAAYGSQILSRLRVAGGAARFSRCGATARTGAAMVASLTFGTACGGAGVTTETGTGGAGVGATTTGAGADAGTSTAGATAPRCFCAIRYKPAANSSTLSKR